LSDYNWGPGRNGRVVDDVNRIDFIKGVPIRLQEPHMSKLERKALCARVVLSFFDFFRDFTRVNFGTTGVAKLLV
jgi:hypothetical protein